MKTAKYLFIFAILVALFGITDVTAKRKMVPTVYMFGFSASFKDSIVHFTNVQAVDSAWMDTKKNFLLGRDNYSYQLRDYFAYTCKMPNRTCLVIASQKRKDVEKKLLKLRQKYTVKAKGKFDVRTLSDSDFRFKTIDMNVEEYDEQTANATKKKKKDKKGKKDKSGKDRKR